MKSILIASTLLFSMSASYARLDCDAGKYAQSYSPNVHTACVDMQKAIEELRKQKLDSFAQGLTQTQVINGELKSPVFSSPNNNGTNTAPTIPTAPSEIQYAPPAPKIQSESDEEANAPSTPQGVTPEHKTPWETPGAKQSGQPKNIYY